MSTIEKVRTLRQGQCVVDLLLGEIASHACKTCGKCVFGYEGITQLEMVFKDMTEKKGRAADKALVEDLCGLMLTQSLCEDGAEIAGAVKEAMNLYGDVFDEHIARKACRAGVCKKFMTYHVLAAKCSGCGECMDVCEDDAIMGKRRFVHVIDQDECSGCGKCMAACREGAIVLAGAEKPRCPKAPIPCKR